jgi:hypothetical protein
MRRLTIPDAAKSKGLMWVEYEVCREFWWEVMGAVELEVQQGSN